MFFLITHVLMNKYYPSLITQFIIGCTFYILTFFIIKDIIDADSIEQYKYYALSLIAIDASFIIYKAKCQPDSTKPIQPQQIIEPKNKIENISTDLKTGTLQSVSLSSEINDYRITHDLSLSESGNDNSMFSTSDEKINDNKINDNKINDNKINDNKINDNKINNNKINNNKTDDKTDDKNEDSIKIFDSSVSNSLKN